MNLGFAVVETLGKALAGVGREETLDKFDGQGYGTLKQEVAEVAVESVTKAQQRFAEIRGGRWLCRPGPR